MRFKMSSIRPKKIIYINYLILKKWSFLKKLVIKTLLVAQKKLRDGKKIQK